MVSGLAFCQERRGMKMHKSIIQRVTAPNGSMFTGPGTNSYLVGVDDITLIDPGPKIEKHLDYLLELSANKIKRILVTHTHPDHSPGAKVLAEKLGVPLYPTMLGRISGNSSRRITLNG